VRKESAITRPGRGLGNMNEIWDEEVADMRETQKLFKQAQAEYEAARETASSLSTRNRSNFSMTKNSKEEERLAHEHERFLEQKLARTETEYRKKVEHLQIVTKEFFAAYTNGSFKEACKSGHSLIPKYLKDPTGESETLKNSSHKKDTFVPKVLGEFAKISTKKAQDSAYLQAVTDALNCLEEEDELLSCTLETYAEQNKIFSLKYSFRFRASVLLVRQADSKDGSLIWYKPTLIVIHGGQELLDRLEETSKVVFENMSKTAQSKLLVFLLQDERKAFESIIAWVLSMRDRVSEFDEFKYSRNYGDTLERPNLTECGSAKDNSSENDMVTLKRNKRKRS
jgi:hypothetical protein